MGFYSKDKKTNLWDFEFKELKEVVMPPADCIMGIGKNGGNVAYFFQNSGGEIYPCDLKIKECEEEEEEKEVTLPDYKTIKLKQNGIKLYVQVIEPDIALWNAQQEEKLFANYGNKTWWKENGNQVLFYGTIVFILGLLYMVFNKLNKFKEAVELLKQMKIILSLII
jgi:hypothetical protein